MTNLHPVFEQVLRTFAPPDLPKTPRFAMTSCSQCGRDTGPGDAGHSSCATHGPAAVAPDLSGLYCFEYTTCTDFAVRCYLDYEKAEDGHGDHPDRSESMELLYAFVGLVDIAGSELMPESLQKQIESDALTAMKEEDAADEFDHGEDRYLERMEYEA